MNIVEPIRNLDKVKEIHKYLKEKSDRDALMYSFGIHTGLRISDILKFRVKDCLKPYYSIREQKTNKQKTYEWNPYLYKELKEYCKGRNPDDYLFKSRKGTNDPITRQRAYNIIKQACNVCGVYNVGTHTLRKTFGYHFYIQSKHDIATLMEIFNHSSESITLRYIGVTQEKSNNSMKKVRLYY